MIDRSENNENLIKRIEELHKQNEELKVRYDKEMMELRKAELIRKIQYNIADAVVNADSLKELFESAREELSKIIDTKNFYIAFYDDEAGIFYSPFEVDEMHTIPKWSAERSLTGMLLKRKKPLLLNKKETIQLAESNQIDLIGETAESWLGVPLITRGKAMGAIVVQSYDNPKAYTESSKEVLEIIANQLSVYIERKKAQEALKESEKRYRSLLENAFDGIYILHGKRFEFVNERFCEITEYSKEELLSESFSMNDMLTEEGRQIIEKRYNDRLKGAKVPNLVEFKILTKSGIIKEIQISNTALSVDNEPRVLGIMRDITEFKKAYALEQEVAVAHKSVEFKKNFLANISHEVRTPLTGVLGMAEILAKEKLDDKQAAYLNTLIQSGENLREIIDLILDYSKIEAGHVKIKMNRFSVEKLIKDALNIFMPAIEKKGIKIESKISHKIPGLIISDRQRVNQILSNLLANAVKFTEKGKICIKATLTDEICGKTIPYNEENVVVKVEVIDTGKGVSEEEKKHLFKPFSQIEQSAVRFIEGTGLGLAICKELVSLLDGDVGLDSQPGKGSNFWFVFKAKIADKDQTKGKSNNYKDHRLNKALSILFVEDKKVTQKVVTLLLNSIGHSVETADNGKQALEMFNPGKYDLILMDIQMPVMDGITATRILREKYKELPPIVGLSANAFEGDRKKYMDMGLDDYLTKPANSDDFLELFDRLF